jgi:hypothetical protein
MKTPAFAGVSVIPVKTGIQPEPRERFGWAPAYAGVTIR